MWLIALSSPCSSYLLQPVFIEPCDWIIGDSEFCVGFPQCLRQLFLII